MDIDDIEKEHTEQAIVAAKTRLRDEVVRHEMTIRDENMFHKVRISDIEKTITWLEKHKKTIS